jgi:CRISPR type I-F-associated protein Csy2
VTKYLILPHLEVSRANALAAGGIISLVPAMAASLMGTAFSLRTGIIVEGVMLIHHSAALLADKHLDKYSTEQDYWLLSMKGATLFDGIDAAGKPTGNTLGSNASQPNAHMNGHWSIVFKLAPSESEKPDGIIEREAATFLLHGARLAGGQIVHYGAPVVTDEMPGIMGQATAANEGKPIAASVLEKTVHGGFVLTDDTHTLNEPDSTKGRTERLLLAALGRPDKSTHQGPESEFDSESESEIKTKIAEASRHRWVSPAVLGYGLVSPLSENQGSRENCLHALCEPLIGLVELQSIRQAIKKQINFNDLFWSPTWITDDVFLITQPNHCYEV